MIRSGRVGAPTYSGCGNVALESSRCAGAENFRQLTGFRRIETARAGTPDEPFAPLVTPYGEIKPQSGAVQLVFLAEVREYNVLQNRPEFVIIQLALSGDRLDFGVIINCHHAPQGERRQLFD